jgi:uncharacterized protein YbbC (DUF1343 family)
MLILCYSKLHLDRPLEGPNVIDPNYNALIGSPIVPYASGGTAWVITLGVKTKGSGFPTPFSVLGAEPWLHALEQLLISLVC